MHGVGFGEHSPQKSVEKLCEDSFVRYGFNFTGLASVAPNNSLERLGITLDYRVITV